MERGHLNTQDTWARKARGHARHEGTWARGHLGTQGTSARGHARHEGTWARKARWHVGHAI